MNIKFGIISYLNESERARNLRIKALESLLDTLYKYWPKIPVVIVAQNWKNFVPKAKNNLEIYYFEKLGITKARKTLFELILGSGCEFLITLDDDSVIEVASQSEADKFISLLEANKSGFSFRRGTDRPLPESIYAPGQLHFGLISRFILENIPFPDVSADHKEGFEDAIFANYCHIKYPELEFDYPTTIGYNFKASYSKVVSTWNLGLGGKSYSTMDRNTNMIIKYLKEHGHLPERFTYSSRTEEL